MNLYFLRHGIAEEPGARKGITDAERALTSEGKQKLRQIARAMSRLELAFDLVLSSPYRRAEQTAAIVARHLGLSAKVQLTDALAPAGSTRELLATLQRGQPVPDEVLLVGHEPDLSELISLLISGQKTGAVVMKKGGLCKLSTVGLRPSRCARLEWLLTPRQLQLIP